MELLERLRRIKKGLWIAVGLAFGVLFLLVTVLVLAALVLHLWDVRNAPKIVKNKIGMEFVSISPGSFLMGSDDGQNGAARVVNISRGFLLGKYEVSAGEWKAVMGKEPPNFRTDSLPAQFVSWIDAQEFIQRLNQKNDGYSYRLPTEAEWEYACRGGEQIEDPDDVELLAWYDGNANNRVHPVGMKHANNWGLFDMRGNVSEWCQDWYDANYDKQRADPKGPGNNQERVKRGGSIFDERSRVRCSFRQGGAPAEILDTNGFRIVAVAAQ
jgi:formylglycine-generating enzyme required for sulfatase activity